MENLNIKGMFKNKNNSSKLQRIGHFQKLVWFEFSLVFETRIFSFYFFLFFNLKAVKLIYEVELIY
jgi:hypothetical protein